LRRAAGQAKIVAIGSSTTAGEGNIMAYPGGLLSFLHNEYPKTIIAMVNKGIDGQEAPIELSAVQYRRHRREARSGDLAGRNECSLAKTRILHLPRSMKTPRPSARSSSSCATRRRPMSS
jgi:hypothetical protein